MSALALVAALALAGPSAADGRPPFLRDLGFDQRLGESLPMDVSFRDESGAAVRLGDYFGDKPVVLTLAYYDCPMLCKLSLNGLAVLAIGLMPGWLLSLCISVLG